MLSIIRHIEYLLQNHDYVVIPGFGAFIAHSVSASCEDSRQLKSPARVINFNNALIHNDGLLANSIMRKNAVSYDQAINLLSSDVAALKSQLFANKEFSFGRIGNFTLSEEQQVVFSPSDSEVAHLAYYGLPSIELRPISNDADLSASPAKKSPVYPTVFSNMLKVAASIAILIVLAVSLTTPISVSQTDYAGINTIITHREKEEKQVITTPADIDNHNQPTPAIASEQVGNEENVPKDGNFHIIIASFASKRQANRFIELSDEQNLSVIGSPQTLYRVSLMSGDSRSELEAVIEAQNLRNRYPDIWISRK